MGSQKLKRRGTKTLKHAGGRPPEGRDYRYKKMRVAKAEDMLRELASKMKYEHDKKIVEEYLKEMIQHYTVLSDDKEGKK